MSSAWQLALKDSKSRLKHLFETKFLADCSFLVGKENNQVLVAGHRSILSAASPVLQDKLAAAGGDNPKITITDVTPETFELMLMYIYTDSVNFEHRTVYDLATAANIYQIPHLLKACLDYMGSSLTTANVLQAYGFALQSSECDELKKKCEEIIKNNTKAVLSDSSFDEACLDVVLAVFSLDTLDIDSELDLLAAADRYAKHISKSGEVGENELAVRKILEKIRFLSLTPEEFAKGRASTTILPASDACAILANVVYEKSGVPMPSGFSLRKDPRKINIVSAIHTETKFTIRIQDIENWLHKSESLWTPSFMLQNLKWRVRVRTEDKDSKKYLCLSMACNWESISDTWSCKGTIEFTLERDDDGDRYFKKSTCIFKKTESQWGYTDFIELPKLLDPDNHYVKDGAITIQVYIKADEPHE